MAEFRFIFPVVIHAAAKRGDNVYPYARYRPLPEVATQPPIEPWNFILHTMAGQRTATAEALYNFIAQPANTGEPHVLLGYADIIQAVPFTVRADNNAKANRWQAGSSWRGAVSVETQDNGSLVDPGIAKAPWNDYQVEHLAGLSAFLHLRYGIPIARCATWDGRGIDGHRKFPEWSIYVGKTCPGETRWNQIPTILGLAREIASWSPPPEEPPVRYFTLVNRPGTLWATSDGLLAVRLEQHQVAARGDVVQPIPVLTEAEAAKYVFVAGLPSLSVQ